MSAIAPLESTTATPLARLITELSTILGDVPIGADSSLGELGVDSVNIAELILLCEQVYQRSIDPEALIITYTTTLLDLDRAFATAVA